MNEESIESVEQLIGIIQRYAEKSVVYRGIKSSRYELLPKIGRRRKNGQVLTTENERYILKLCKQRLVCPETVGSLRLARFPSRGSPRRQW